MPAGTTLLRAIPGTEFESFIDRFRQSLKSDPFTTWMILPTHRLIRTARELLIASGTAFIPDHIGTLDQFASFLITRYGGGIRQIDAPTARIILLGVLGRHKSDLPLFFAQRRPSAKTIQDLQTLISVITRRTIGYPDCLGDLKSSKSDQISLILTRYREHLRVRDLVDGDTLLEWAVSFLQGLSPDTGGSILRNALFYGIFEPLPLEKQVISLMLRIAENGEYVIPDGDDQSVFVDSGEWLGPAFCHPGTPFDAAEERTSIFMAEQGHETRHIPGLFLSACIDPANEMRAIAEQIVRLHTRGIPYHEMVVASSDLRTALGYAGEILPDYAIPYHTSSPLPLTQAPLISFYLQIGELIEKGIRYEELIQVIQSPYLRFWWTEDAGSEPEPGQDRHLLSYQNVEIICRTYGISGGYIDWEEQTSRIHTLITGTISESPPEKPKTNGKVRRRGGYGPERPLPVRSITTTLAGIRALVAVFRRLSEKRTMQEHIRVFIEVLGDIGSPVPDSGTGQVRNCHDLLEEELRIAGRFSQVLDHLGELTRAGIIAGTDCEKPVPFSWYISTLRLLIQDATLEPDSAENGVLLTGIREIAHQHYPFLFLASLNEGEIPRLSTRLPFTNGSESSRMETRSLGEILRQERYQFLAALLAGSRETYLSYYQHRDERTILPSAFLDPLMKAFDLPEWAGEETWEHEETDDRAGEKPGPGRCARSIAARKAGEFIREEEWNRALAFLGEDEELSTILHRITIERNFRFRLNRSAYDGVLASTPGIRSRLAEHFSPTHRWSASMLESYARCPFRFYLERVVRIKPLADLGTDLSPVAKGNLIHTVLCRFTRQMHDSGQFPLIPGAHDAAVSAITRIAEEEFEKVPYKTPLWFARRRQLLGGSEIGTGIFERFVAAEETRLHPDERGRNPEPYIPSVFEYSFGEAVPGPDDDPTSTHEPVDLAMIAQDVRTRREGGEKTGKLPSMPDPGPIPGPVLLTGKIDRVDLSPGGRFGVVDYKTGMSIPTTTEISRLQVLQLPLYIHAYERITGKNGVYGSYYHISRSITHAITLYDPEHKHTLPRGKMPRSAPEWQRIMDQAVTDSCRYVSQIQKGIFPIQPCIACKPDWYCPYATICRFQPDRGSRLCEWMIYPDPGDADTGEPLTEGPDGEGGGV